MYESNNYVLKVDTREKIKANMKKNYCPTVNYETVNIIS